MNKYELINNDIIPVRNAKLDLSLQHQHHQFQNPYEREKQGNPPHKNQREESNDY